MINKNQNIEILRKVASGEMCPEEAHTKLMFFSLLDNINDVKDINIPNETLIKEVAIDLYKDSNRPSFNAGVFIHGAMWLKNML